MTRAGGPGIVVVGASLAGQRTCSALRRNGYDGPLTVIGEEPHAPYERPPLSKEFLTGRAEPEAPSLPAADLRIRWMLGERAIGLDLACRRVELADGPAVPFTGLVIATGSAPRPWPGPHPPRVAVFRTLDDARLLRDRLRLGAHLLVVGGGFLGSELAAAATAIGVPVTLVEAQPHPLVGVLGPAAGEFLTDLHRRAGVDVRTGTRVESFTGAGRVTGAHLSDGSWVPADHAVVALGASPRTEWLASSGLRVDDGLVCDQHGRALRTDGTPARGVVVAGDVARWPTRGRPSAGSCLATGRTRWSRRRSPPAPCLRRTIRPPTGPSPRSGPTCMASGSAPSACPRSPTPSRCTSATRTPGGWT
jgi:NADPH-dependent 2,4-dienoyl-CoA reductase/sulfur reductase-like enzyme